MSLAALRRPPAIVGILAVGALVAGVVALWFGSAPGSPFSHLLKAYQPREFCMNYERGVIWLSVIADACIAVAYYSIPVALIYFVRRRSDLSFSWIFVCFAVFILACGTTHVMNIVAIWYAPYRLDGVLKLFTALVSIATAGMLWPLIPKALAIPSPATLRAANADLAREIEVRRTAEESLRTAQGGLERRVQDRTAELSAANAQLQAEIAARTAAEQERETLLVREREARAEAEQANRIKDEFLATLSHELRTPIGAITNWVYLLRTAPPTPAELDEALAVIDRNARAQATLIDDLLDTSRILSGKMRLQQEPLPIGPVLQTVLETVRPAAAERGIHLERLDTLGEQLVFADPGRLQQAIWNLLNNAVKFTPKGGRVTLNATERNGGIEVQVKDTGVGIAAEFLPKLFERFHQFDSSTTRRHGGLGLGLSIVREIVALHGGTVRAASDGLGQGSTFFLWLPMLSANASAALAPARAGAAGAATGTRLDGVKLLLVDDEPDSRRSLQRVLESHGASILPAANLGEALDLLRRHRPALLVSDIGMPGEDGYSLIRRVRALADPTLREIPAVAVTAFAREEDRAKALAAGFQSHVTKPVDPGQLLAALEPLLRT